MSDEEHEFHGGDAGASETYPSQAGNLKKGGYIVINERPCKIMEITTSKAGKHGHAKASIVGIDIFTDKKLEDSAPTSHNVSVPNVTRKELTLLDIAEDGFISLMNEDGSTKDDLKLPEDDMGVKIKADWEAGKELLLTVIAAMKQEKVVTYREAQAVQK